MTIVKIDGVAIPVTTAVSWQLVSGVRPALMEFEAHPDAYEKIMRGRGFGPVTLEIEGGGEGTKIEGLFVIKNDPGMNEFVRQIVLADRRYWWSYTHIVRRYNVRRKTGTRRLAGELQELDTYVDRESFVRSSLFNEEEPWDGEQVLYDVIRQIQDNDPFSNELPGLDISVEARDIARDYPVENLRIDERADSALDRVLRYLPELGVTVREDGSIYIYAKSSGDTMLDSLKPGIWDMGFAEEVDFRAVRPKEVRVLFTREVELRFDYRELGDLGTASPPSDDERVMENVLPIPDPELEVNGEPLAQGTWITFKEALDSWPPAPGIDRQLREADIRRNYTPYLDLWSVLGNLGENAPDPLWATRIALIQNHWRRTFRISRKWLDAMLSFGAYRVSTIDVRTGQRASAPAYCDYFYVPGQRSTSRTGVDQWFAANVAAYPAGGVLGPDAIVAPAVVRVIDVDQGIVQIDLQIDPLKLMQMVVPGRIFAEPQGKATLPGRNGNVDERTELEVGANVYPIAWDSVYAEDVGKYPIVAPEWDLALIVTAVPGWPNDAGQLHREIVRPLDVAKNLPPAARSGLLNTRGPAMEVRVSGGYETARVAWLDSEADEIERLFGVRRDAEGEREPVNQEVIDNLTINGGTAEGLDQFGKGASLKEIAKAIAGRVYAGFADRDIGTLTSRVTPGLHPEGWIDEILHTVTAEGMALTKITVPPDRGPTIDPLARMDAGTRAILMKLAEPGKKG